MHSIRNTGRPHPEEITSRSDLRSPAPSLADRIRIALQEWQTKIVARQGPGEMPDAKITARIVVQLKTLNSEIHLPNRPYLQESLIKQLEKTAQQIEKLLKRDERTGQNKFDNVYVNSIGPDQLGDLPGILVLKEREASTLLERGSFSFQEITQAEHLLHTCAEYQRACIDLNLSFNFQSAVLENLETTLRPTLDMHMRVREDASRFLQEIRDSQPIFSEIYRMLIREKTAASYIEKYNQASALLQKFTEQLMTFRQDPNCFQVIGTQLSNAESLLARNQEVLISSLSSLDSAEQILLKQNSAQLFERTHWVGHSRNQYQIRGDQPSGELSLSRSACSGTSIATVHQLLANPNALLDGGETFEHLLEEGVRIYLAALASFNERLNLEEIRILLLTTLTNEGFNRFLEVVRDCNGNCNEVQLREIYRQFVAWAKEKAQAELTDHQKLEQLFNALFRRIDFRRPEGAFFTLNDEALRPFEEEKLDRISEGTFKFRDRTAPAVYKDFFREMERIAQSNGTSVGAIVHIGAIIFSVAMYPNGRILIADSHGIEFVRYPRTNGCPFAVMMAENIDDAAALMALHKPKQEEIPGYDLPDGFYYFYKLHGGAERVPLDEAPFVEAHHSKFTGVRPQITATTENQSSEESKIQSAYLSRLKELGEAASQEHKQLLTDLGEAFTHVQSLHKLKQNKDSFIRIIDELLERMDPQLKSYYLYKRSQSRTFTEIIAAISAMRNLI